MQLRKESLKKSGLPGFEPWPLRYRCSALTNWANKPTGSWSLNWFVIYPGKMKMKLWIYEIQIYDSSTVVKFRTWEMEMERKSSKEYSSSETQGQLVGTTGFSWAKVYNKSGRAPGHLLLPNEFQKRLKSRLLIGQKNICLANQRRGTAGRLSCLLTRGCFLHRTP